MRRNDPKVLIIRPGAMGDVCMAVPFAAALARHCEVHWLVGRAYAAIPRAFPQVVCRLIPVTPRRDRPFPDSLRAALCQQRYAAVLDLSHWPRVAELVSRLDEVPVRGITDDPVQDELLQVKPSGVDPHTAYTCRVPVPPQCHQVEKWCRLVRAALGIDLTIDWPLPPVRRSDQPLRLFVHPHASKRSKQWPAHRFAEVLRRLARDRPLRCYINSGARSELPQALGLWLRLRAAGVRARIVLRERSYQRLRAVLRRADLALGCDSGPMHLAALLGTPSVVLYGPYSASEFGPLWRSQAVQPPRPGQPATCIVPGRVLQALRAATAARCEHASP
jgi:ADP-heptose:LPS heptosyltransferase